MNLGTAGVLAAVLALASPTASAQEAPPAPEAAEAEVFGESSFDDDEFAQQQRQDGEPEPVTIGDITSVATLDHVYSEQTMRACRGDTILLSRHKGEDGSHAATVAQTRERDSVYYNVGGCSLAPLNGRYIDAGKACNVAKYRNQRGWVMYVCSSTSSLPLFLSCL